MRMKFPYPSLISIAHMLRMILVFLSIAPVRSLATVNTHAIEGYADKLSVSPGETIKFSIHLPEGHHEYTVRIFRYGADGSGPNSFGSQVAGPFTGTNGQRRDYDQSSYKDGANWPMTFSMKIPAAKTPGIAPCTGAALPAVVWKSGIYTAKITDTGSVPHQYHHITFIVKNANGDRKSIALLASTNTWQAYNFWPGPENGGACFYNNLSLHGEQTDVSFLRPNPYATPEVHNDYSGNPGFLPLYRTEHLAAGELRVARWLEANHKNYSMYTDYDLQSIPGLLDATIFKTVIINTHSEYWSREMYDAVNLYLSRGGNLVCLSGNAVYWRVKLNMELKTMHKGVNWTPQEQGNLHGLGSFGASGIAESYCAPYRLVKPEHWVFKNTNPVHDDIMGRPLIGETGVMSGVPASPGGVYSCCPSGQHGAAGWEIDHTNFGSPDFRLFAREYTRLGEAYQASGYQSADAIYMKRASAGQVFNLGSVTAGQSLLIDGPLSETLLTVLDKFKALSFSDFTRDGNPDIIASKPDGTVWRFNGNGAGRHSAGTQFTSGWGGLNLILAPGDFDGDGYSDLIGRDNAGKLWLYRGTGQGSVTSPRVEIGAGWGVFNTIVAPGDFNGDGVPDLIARKPDGTLWKYLGTGDGFLITPNASFNIGWQIFDTIIAPGDLDEDSHPDLLARKPDGTLWRYGSDANGNLLSGVPIADRMNQYVEMITPGDFNGDHHADILARRPNGSLWLLGGNGDGTLKPAPATPISSGWNAFSHMVGVW